MKLKQIHEGAVASARSDIVSMINDQAMAMAHELQRIIKRKPHLHETESSSAPAVINVDTSAGPIQVQIFGDSEYKVEISDDIAALLDIDNVYSYKFADDSIDRIAEIYEAVKEWS